MEPGTFSRRGGILDIFPPDAVDPIRVELFDDEVESIHVFDPLTGQVLQRVADAGPLEAVVREMLRPMLKDWLDEHLPEIVEELVTREIARITRRS